jgi:hypothetical protein
MTQRISYERWRAAVLAKGDLLTGLLPCLLLLSAISYMKANRFLTATEPLFIPRFAGCGQPAFDSAGAESTSSRLVPQQARLDGFLFDHCKSIFLTDKTAGPRMVDVAAAAGRAGDVCKPAAFPMKPLQGRYDRGPILHI